MSEWWKGSFSPKDVADNEKHQTATTEEEKKRAPLPDQVVYGVPPEVANKIRDSKKRRRIVGQQGTTTLAQPVLARVTYMDVGCWIGNAPDEHDTAAHWGKKRYFGVVFGRLSVLCAYRPWETAGKPAPHFAENWTLPASDLRETPQYKRVLPLLKALSSDPHLGPVVVTKAMLNDQPEAVAPPEDRIHVILGDLHAPVMTDHAQTTAGALAENPTDFPGTIHALPGAHMQAAQQLGLIHFGPTMKYPLRGRYDRGVVAPSLVPGLARLFGEGAKATVNHETAATVITTAVGLSAPARIVFGAVGAATGAATAAGLGSIASATRLRTWSDHDAVDLPVVEDWFDRYHGRTGKLGADVFDSAGADLLAWLRMIKAYQSDSNAQQPPVRLMQLGDLFDFWIGLQCPFDLVGGARNFPDPSSARRFVNHWLAESLRNPAIEFLWNFDTHEPPVTDDRLKTVFLHGNHDTYMGTSLLQGREPLLSQFVESDKGLIAQHGHQDDAFNNEPTAGIGYLLTQAVFLDNYVRTIEDPMSSLKTKLFGGMWTRLGYDEAALKNCVFQRLDAGAPPASTFIMGHTHEPALQRVNVVEKIPAKTAVSSPPPELPLPSSQVCRPGDGNMVRAVVAFKQVYILDDHGKEPWNLRAFISPVSGKSAGADVTLFDEMPIEKGKSAQVGASPLSVSVPSDDRVEILIQGWQGHRSHSTNDPFLAPMEEFWNYVVGKISDLTPDFLKSKTEFDVITIRVWPHTWDGTRTLESKHFRVTFGLDWG